MMRFNCALVVLVLVFFPVFAYSADLFRWVDERGRVHFTDTLHNIPEKHRASATRIKARETPRSQELPKPSFPEKVSVPFQRKDQLVIIQVTVNEKTSANFVVDTGASHTLISRATVKELGIDIEKSFPRFPSRPPTGLSSSL